MVRVVATAQNDNSVEPQHLQTRWWSTPVRLRLQAIDPTASVVSAARGVRGTGDCRQPETPSSVVWTAVTNAASVHRVVIEVDHSGVGAKLWLIAPTGRCRSDDLLTAPGVGY